MEDQQIVQLYLDRAESAIAQTADKYGALLLSIARNILRSREDSEECVNDTYLSAWNAIPPSRPRSLSPWLGRITRNLALDRYDYNHAQKRNARFDAVLDELAECIPGPLLEAEVENREIGRIVDAFLQTLPEKNRTLFLRRYWYCQSIERIADSMGVGQSQVKSILFRCRKRLRSALEREEIYL